MRKKLILFDIDGTLIVSGGAGARAMTRAFEDTWGIPDALRQVDIAGRTDLIILSDALALIGRGTPPADLVARFRDIYCGYLREELSTTATRTGDAASASNGHRRPHADSPWRRSESARRSGVLPGVRPLLDALAARPDVSLALLTGNFPQSAEIKLRHFDLWHYFPWGVWGDEAVDRHDLLPLALRRHRDRATQPIDPADVIIVGDTPHDVSCAHRGSAKVVAVATGNFDTASLADCRPDVLCADLADPAPLLALLDR